MSTAPDEKSIAFREGLRARQDGIKLKDSALRSLRFGSRQYEEYVAGYDSLDAAKPQDQK